jgi:CRISPR-associated protein Csd1
MTLLASLVRRWEAGVWTDGPLVPENGLAPRGSAPTNVGFELVLDPDGRLREARLLGAPNETPPRFAVMHLPDIERTSGDAAAFLWDKTEYLLGVTNVGSPKAPEAGQKDKSQRRHNLFVAQMTERIGDDPDEGLQAVMAFLAAWTPEAFAEEPLLLPEMLDLNGVFRLEGDRHDAADHGGEPAPRYVHERPAARALWTPRDPEPSDDAPTDLVTGVRAMPARLHSKIKGVAGGQAAGAPIASVNAPAFKSHGWADGLDAPVSPATSHAYRTALNALLARGGEGRALIDRGTKRHGAKKRPPALRNKGIVGDTTVAFWAEAGGETDIAPAEAITGAVLGETEGFDYLSGFSREDAQEDPEADAKRKTQAQRTLGAAIGELAAGRRFDLGLRRALDPGTTIHVLGLSPNEGRISVRFHHAGSLGALARNVQDHWEEMRLGDRDDRPRARALVREAAVHRWDANTKLWKVQKDAEPPKRLAGELLRAILEGTPYPETLAAAILLRIRSERGHVNGRRAALLKAVFNRNHSERNGGPMEPGLDRHRRTPGYLLGQLFALYERVEDASQAQYDEAGKRIGGGRNATLRDRYFAAASAGPARVFDTLGKSAVHDLAKIRKTAGGGLAHTFEREIGRVMGALAALAQRRSDEEGEVDLIPRTLAAPAQAEFVVGYWNMKFASLKRLDVEGASEDPNTTHETAQ